jgi:hypothetical protein
VGEWGSVFGDPVVATAILDRLHHRHVLTIRGDSYRLREKRRNGLLQRPHRRRRPCRHDADHPDAALFASLARCLQPAEP